MAKHAQRNSTKNATIAPATAQNQHAFQGAGWLALLFAAVGFVASAMLVLEHFGAMSLPGCGVGSACAAAAASVWGKVLGIPLSFIGLAHFVAVGVIIIITRGRVATPILWGVRIAAMLSLVYAGIAIGANLLCVYCLVVHGSNVLLALSLGSAHTLTFDRWVRQAVVGTVAGAAVYLVLIPTNIRYDKMLRERAEVALAESQHRPHLRSLRLRRHRNSSGDIDSGQNELRFVLLCSRITSARTATRSSRSSRG
jgi:uncharacterized membrane protein